MSSAIENQAVVKGSIVARRTHPTLAEYDIVEVKVESIGDVPAKRNLLRSTSGNLLQLTVRRQLLGRATIGDTVRCRAKRIPSGAMCEQNPEPANFEVTPGG